jgi:chromosomal replication initiation ATPase DnaA
MARDVLEPVSFGPTTMARETPRLSEVLFKSKGFDSLAPVPSNVEALETALLFSTGLQSFAALVGPSGWGKTHLLEAVAGRLRNDAGYRRCHVHTASDWVSNPPRTEAHEPLILDNVQDVLAKARSRVLLRLALERRVKAGRPTILGFTSTRATRSIKTLLPQTREWGIATIGSPAPAERQIVVRKIAESESVAISDELVKLLAVKLKGNGLTLRGAMKRLKLHESSWLGPRGTLRACGVLTPFFSDNSSWDLREHILECAKAYTVSCAGVTASELAVYVMLREALLAEADVARFMDVPQGQAYGTATRLEAKLKDCPDSRAMVNNFIERAIAKLQSD